MQIQKGLVKYKDRNDILCTYGLTDDGKQYYFLDNTSMSNGNIIASTVLVEAIDPVVVASSIGVIDANGVVVIPFEHRSIKPVIDGLLLVEVANSTTPSVVEANSMRSDPLAATKLVTTPAAIKEKINAKMGSEGRFIFNDQFSEATICDYSGKNILDNQYFSFIAIKNNETLYLSKNTADSPVLEYSITNHQFVESAVEPAPLDVQNTEVTQETIDGAMQAEEKVVGFNADDITEKDFEAVVDGSPVEEPLPVAPSVVDAGSAEVHVPSETPAEEVVDEEDDDDSEEPLSVIPDAITPEVNAKEEVEEVDDPLKLDQSLVDNPVTESLSTESVDVPTSLDTDLPLEGLGEDVPAAEVASDIPTSLDLDSPVEESTSNEEVPVDIPTSLDMDDESETHTVSEDAVPVTEDVVDETPVEVPASIADEMAFEGTVVPEEEVAPAAEVPAEDDDGLPEVVLPDDDVVAEESVVEESVPEGVTEETSVEESVESPEEVIEEPPVEESVEATEEVVEEPPVEEVVEATEEVVEETTVEEVSEPVNDMATEVQGESAETVVENEEADDKLMEFDFAEKNEEVEETLPNADEVDELEEPVDEVVSEFKNDLFDVDLESDIFADSTVHADKIDVDDSYNDFSYKVGNPKDTIMEDIASTMTNLIRQNKNQKQVIASYEDKLDQAAAAYKKVVDKARNQLRETEILKNKIKNYETIVTKLEAKLEVLENKVRDQEKVIASQTRELESLRPQVEGKEELVRILADAQNLLDQAA